MLGIKTKRILVDTKEVESSNDKPEDLFLKPLHQERMEGGGDRWEVER